MNLPRQLHPGAGAEAAGGSELLGSNAGQDGACHDSDHYNQPLAEASLIACPDCDLLQRLPEVALGGSARCPRCDKELWRRPEDSLNRTLALTLGAALLYVVANTVPMLGLTIVGRAASTTVIGGAEHLWSNGQRMVGVLVMLTAVIAPALQI